MLNHINHILIKRTTNYIIKTFNVTYFDISFRSDRFRTSVNVWGDAVGTGIVQKFSKGFLRKLDAEEDYKEKSNGGVYNDGYIPSYIPSVEASENTDL